MKIWIFLTFMLIDYIIIAHRLVHININDK